MAQMLPDNMVHYPSPCGPFIQLMQEACLLDIPLWQQKCLGHSHVWIAVFESTIQYLKTENRLLLSLWPPSAADPFPSLYTASLAPRPTQSLSVCAHTGLWPFTNAAYNSADSPSVLSTEHCTRFLYMACLKECVCDRDLECQMAQSVLVCPKQSV